MSFLQPITASQTSHFANPVVKRLVRRGIINLQQDLDKLECLLTGKDNVYLFTGRGPSSRRLHIGHLVPFMLTAGLQRSLDCPVIVQISDDEKMADHMDADMNILDIQRVGFVKDRLFIFKNTDMIGKMYREIVELSSRLRVKDLQKVFGFDDLDPLLKYWYPAVQMVPALHPESFPGLTESMQCIVPCSIDQYPFFRLARKLHNNQDHRKPIVICGSDYLPGIKSDKMSSSDPRNAIWIDDPDLEAKIRMGRSWNGIDVGLRQDLAYQITRIFEPDDRVFTQIHTDYVDLKRMGSLDLKMHAFRLLRQVFEKKYFMDSFTVDQK